MSLLDKLNTKIGNFIIKYQYLILFGFGIVNFIDGLVSKSQITMWFSGVFIGWGFDIILRKLK